MALTNDWRARAPITIQPAQVALAAFPLHLDASCFPSEALDPTAANAARSDGADIRFTVDDAGQVELPFDLVRWVQAAAAQDRRASVHVRLVALATTAQTIYVWYGNPHATLPAADAANGREAVWDTAYDGVYHLTNGTAIPNACAGALPDATIEGAPSVIVDAPCGAAIDFDGTDDALIIGALNSDDATFEVVLQATTTTDQYAIATTNASPLNASFALLIAGAKPAAYADADGGAAYGYTYVDTVNASTTSWEYWTFRQRSLAGAAETLPVPATEQSHQAGIVANGRLHSIAGHPAGNLTAIATHNRYDPTTQTWDTLTPIPVARSGMGVARLDGKIYCFGGTTNGTTASARTDVYDEATNTWTQGLDLPAALAANASQGQAACSDGTYLYVSANAELWRYDPAGPAWTQLDAGYTQGNYKTLIHHDGALYAIGGYAYGTQVHRYVIATDTWDSTQWDTAPYSAWAHAVDHIANGEFFIAFGRPGGTEQSRRAYRYAPATKTWTRLPDYDIPTNAVAAGVIGDRAYIYGAWCIGKAETYSVGHHACFDLTTNQWLTTPQLHEFIRNATSISGRIVTAPLYPGTGRLCAARADNGTTLRGTMRIAEIRRSAVARSRDWLDATRLTLLTPTALAAAGTPTTLAVDATAAGATLQGASTLAAGAASAGGGTPATAAGATLTGAAVLTPGAASVPTGGTAAGVTLTASATLDTETWASAVDPTVPPHENPTTEAVRDNFAAIKAELEWLDRRLRTLGA